MLLGTDEATGLFRS